MAGMLYATEDDSSMIWSALWLWGLLMECCRCDSSCKLTPKSRLFSGPSLRGCGGVLHSSPSLDTPPGPKWKQSKGSLEASRKRAHLTFLSQQLLSFSFSAGFLLSGVILIPAVFSILFLLPPFSPLFHPSTRFFYRSHGPGAEHVRPDLFI